MDQKKNISIPDLALRVIRGEFGNGVERKNKLGYLYPVVQNVVNRKLSCKYEYPIDESLIEEIAKKAMNGEFGPIDELKINLDYIYSRVQEKINEITQEELKNKSIEDIAYDVIKGKYGTGEYRKNILGNLYEKVNNKVNEILDAVKKIEKKEINEINEKEQNSNGNKINEDKNLIQASGIEKLSIEELSNKVIRGEFGNGKIRKQKLGDLYPIVQNRVNERLGCNARCDIDETSIEIWLKE